jgi:hypothetical protein
MLELICEVRPGDCGTCSDPAWRRRSRLGRRSRTDSRLVPRPVHLGERDARRGGAAVASIWLGQQRNKLRWHQEAEWTLLWAIGKVEALGLPADTCDTRRLCAEIMPPVGSDIAAFLASAELRSAGTLLAEDDRTYDLWCRAHAARREGDPLPEDLSWGVLHERRYAFEWLDGMQEWDDVSCDT